jgi:hypothetical protein
MNEGISFYAILITSVFILVVALISVLVWIFDGDDLPDYQDDEYEDYNDRTG